MELSDFIKNTLVEIYSGVNSAISEIEDKKYSGAVNPIDINRLKTSDLKDHSTELKFDIAVTASDKDSGDVKGGIKVWSLELGGSASTESANSKITRIQFSIPMLTPATHVETKDLQGIFTPSRKKSD